MVGWKDRHKMLCDVTFATNSYKYRKKQIFYWCIDLEKLSV